VRFQSLIGKIKTYLKEQLEKAGIEFQSLIGKIKTP